MTTLAFMCELFRINGIVPLKLAVLAGLIFPCLKAPRSLEYSPLKVETFVLEAAFLPPFPDKLFILLFMRVPYSRRARDKTLNVCLLLEKRSEG